MSKRSFSKIRENILNLIKSNKKLTATELSKLMNADYRTTKRHLIWLKGLEKIESRNEGRKTYYFLKLKK